MREFIEDIHEHMDSGYGRAQAHTKKQLPKRFYENVEISENEDGFGVALDGRIAKTPGRTPVLVPSRELAQLLAAEWAAQKSHIDAANMPTVRLINSAIEGKAAREAILAEILQFIGNDLMLFRAEAPKELVALQDHHWDTMLVKISRHFEVAFKPVVGIMHQDQPTATLDRFKQELSGTNFLAATALMSITGLTGSGLLALVLRHELSDAQTVWDAAHVDEDYNAALWGADGEAISRLEKRRKEYNAALQVLPLVDKISGQAP